VDVFRRAVYGNRDDDRKSWFIKNAFHRVVERVYKNQARTRKSISLGVLGSTCSLLYNLRTTFNILKHV
jgi:hypothetical protein